MAILIFFIPPVLDAPVEGINLTELCRDLGSVTARHSSSGREPNFAALNRGRHLCSAGRPSRWALAQIIVYFWFVDGVVFSHM